MDFAMPLPARLATVPASRAVQSAESAEPRCPELSPFYRGHSEFSVRRVLTNSRSSLGKILWTDADSQLRIAVDGCAKIRKRSVG